MTEPIRAVVFDAVGTLMYPQPSVADAYRAALKQFCNVELDEATVLKQVHNAMKQRSTGQDFVTSEEAERAFWADLVNSLCPNSAGFESCFEHLFQHFADAGNWRCFDDVAACFKDLLKADLKLAIASNFDRRLDSVCDGLPELCHVDVRVISSVVGFRKPSGQFFAAVAERLSLPPEQILMIGDDATNDVRGALDAGIQALWLTRRPASPEQTAEFEQRPGVAIASSLEGIDGDWVARFQKARFGADGADGATS